MGVFVSLLIAAALWAAPALGQQRISSEDFAKKVAISDMMEIQSSQLVLSRSPDSDTFAEKMPLGGKIGFHGGKVHRPRVLEMRTLKLVGRDRDGHCVVNVSLPWTPSMSDVMATGAQ